MHWNNIRKLTGFCLPLSVLWCWEQTIRDKSTKKSKRTMTPLLPQWSKESPRFFSIFKSIFIRSFSKISKLMHCWHNIWVKHIKFFFYPARKCSCLSKPRLNIAPKKRILDDLGKLSCISFRPVFFRRILNFCRLCPTPLVILQVAPLAIFVLIPMHLKWSLAALQCSQALHQTRPSPHH